MNVFQAGVQYDDFKGSVAADRADEASFLDYLKEAGLVEDGERIVGIRVVFGGNHGTEIDKPGVVAYLFKSDKFVEQPEQVRAVEVDIPIAKLFSFFKRFDLVMTDKALNLEKTSVDGPGHG